jgi:hypothetical protein
MPKYRIRSAVKGAKSIARKIKHKIGGRKSGRGTNQISTSELDLMLSKVRKRDRNKLRRAIAARDHLPS